MKYPDDATECLKVVWAETYPEADLPQPAEETDPEDLI